MINETSNFGSWTNFPDRISGLDNPWTRLPIVAIVALALWLGLLTLCGFLLRGLVPAVVAPAAIDARLIELPGAVGSPMSGGTSAASPRNSGPSSATTEAATTPPATARKTVASRETGLHANPGHQSRHRQTVARLPAALYPAEHSSNQSPPLKVNAPPIASGQQLVSQKRPQGTDAADHVSASTVSAGGRNLGAGIGDGVGAAIGAGSSSGDGIGSGARAIYAPVPSIPDDMRDEVMQATAVARFHVARDGRATVALVTPTDFAELDSLILDTLSHWRFQPAVRDGNPIESDAEVRLHISVQ